MKYVARVGQRSTAMQPLQTVSQCFVVVRQMRNHLLNRVFARGDHAKEIGQDGVGYASLYGVRKIITRNGKSLHSYHP